LTAVADVRKPITQRGSIASMDIRGHSGGIPPARLPSFQPPT
jgi:hypothetical protein